MKLKALLTSLIVLFLITLCLLVPTNFDVQASHTQGFYKENINYVDFAAPIYTDEEYKERVMSLPGAKVLNFSYNKRVRSGIEAYTVVHRGTAESVLGLQSVFFPIFEEALERHNLPKELRNLPVIESALKPKAKSHAGAAGMWQFISSTGKEYGLRINSEVDERYDYYLASDAAARYLKRMHKRFGDWLLVIAAYNCGPGRVNSAIKKAGSRDIWDIYKYLPKETRTYVPLFIGASYLMKYYYYHQLNPLYPESAYQALETTTVYNKLKFKDISEMSGTPMYQIEFLNPSYKKKYIPDNSKGYILTLPKLGMARWRGDYSAEALAGSGQYTPARNSYHPPAALQNSNSIVNNVPPSPTVTRIISTEKPSETKRVKKPKKKYTNTRKEIPDGEREKVTIKIGDEEKEVIIYEMKRGDNLSVISARYPGVSVKDIIRLNNITDYRKLRRGTRLYIGS